MRPIRGRRIAAAAVIGLTAAGGGAAYAATIAGHHASPAVAPVSASAVAVRAGALEHFGHPGRGPGEWLSAAVSYLGLTADELRTQLQSGKTLAQIAQATPNRTVDGLVAAMVADAKQKLAAAVSAGKLTQAQADAIGAQLTQRVTDLVNGTRPSVPAPGARPSVPAPGTRGPLPGHHGFGFGFGFGGQPASGTTA